MHAFAGPTGESDAIIAEHLADQVVHGGLLEAAMVDTTLLKAVEGSRAPDFFGQEISDIDGAILAAEHPIGNAGTLDLLASVCGLILGLVEHRSRLAVVQMAVEGLS
jgi:hypothetical protein